MKINKINGCQRFIVVFVTFLGVIMVYLTRHSLNLTMTKLNPPNKPRSFEETYNWSAKLESVIHAAFYIGYVPGHAPGAYFAEKFGGKMTLNGCLFITSILTALTPIAIKWGGHGGLIAIRVMMGIAAAPAFPAVGGILSSWIPLKERGTSSAFVLGGVQVGSMLASLLSGEILQGTKGYANVFFVIGGLCLAWNILFFFTVSNRPENDPRISDEEREYLSREIGELSDKKRNANVPWSGLLTSKPVWALIIAQLGHDWAIFFISSYIPKYFKNVLKLDYKLAGRYIALSYFCAYIFSVFCGYLGGILIRRKIVTITFSRKFFTFLSTIIPGIFLVSSSYVSHITFAITFIAFCIGLMGAFYAGNRVNVLDICPNYTASLLGLVNGIGAIAGIIAIFSTGLLTPKDSADEWGTVFWITFAVLATTTLVYLIWASGEVQSWNDNPEEENCLSNLFKRKGADIVSDDNNSNQ